MENNNIFSFISYFNNRIVFFITLFIHYVTTLHKKCTLKVRQYI